MNIKQIKTLEQIEDFLISVGTGEPVPVRRVRDQAYLLARKLTMLDRNAEIERFRETRQWIDLVEELDEL
ncbi:MAG: hypothetical protein O3A63_19615, partial [Proteobacteria bacterium]|nr:hypothetical protein [Pseudomonadota bacterium]